MLNSKRTDRLYLAGAAAIVIALVLSYLLSAEAQINANRTLSKLRLEDSKGMIMYLYGHAKTAAAATVLIAAEQTLVPVLPKTAIMQASYVYFGKPLGLVLCTAGISAGLLVTFVIAKAVSILLKKRIWFRGLENSTMKYGSAFVFVFSLLPFWLSALSGYLAGLAGMEFKKYLPFAVVGQFICLVLFY